MPTHQLADRFRKKAVRQTAMAAGLNMCFLPIAKIYFDATAIAEAQKAKAKKDISVTLPAGEIIKAKIRAVM